MTRHVFVKLAAMMVSAAAIGASAAYAQSSTGQITVLYDAFGKTSTMKKDWGFSALIEYGTPDGIVLIVGCSHSTIEKIVEAAKSTLNKPIHLVLGGTHLLPAKDDQISSIALSLRDSWNVRYVAPVHCTGEPAFAILKETFGDRYVYAGLGTAVLLGPKITVKAEAGQPNKKAMDEEDLCSYRDAMTRGPLRALLGRDKRLARAQQ